MKINLQTFVFLFLVVLSAKLARAQYPEWKDPNSLPIWMTPEEEGRKHEIGKKFLKSAAIIGEVRNVAEFERMEGVLVRYPLGLPTSFIATMSSHTVVYTLVSSTTNENAARSAYQSAGATMTNCKFISAPTDSYWTRDYGPWYVVNENNQMCIVDFPYNRLRPNDDAVPGILSNYLNVPMYSMPVVHTGGNYMTDGWGISASSDLVYDENSNNQTWVKQQMNDYLGIDTYHVTIDPLGGIKHIDCWGKFLDVDKVLITKVPTTNSNYAKYEQVASYFASQTSSYGTPFQVFRVNSPNGEPYTNSLILNNKVYVPRKYSSTSNATDLAALEVYRQAMPGYEVVGIYSSNWLTSDALHCRAIGMADRQMLYIKHLPLSGLKAYQREYGITAEILALSGLQLKSDSLFLIYKTNVRPWDTLNLVNTGGSQYGTALPLNPGETEVSYYLYAVDNSGKRENHPFIGRPDPHVFTVSQPVVFADFSASTTSASTGEYITFTDQTSGGPLTSWKWNFGEGAVPREAEGQGPHQVVYSSGGLKSVSLIVNGQYTALKNNFITINDNAVYSASATYSGGDLPTDSQFTDLTSSSSCPGVLAISIPSGAVISGVNVSYSMTAQFYGYMADQRSQLRCLSPGGMSEPVLTSGVGNFTGTYHYKRERLDIANGVQGGGDIIFELHTGRTWSYSGYNGCQTYNNKVDNDSWTVTVYYVFTKIPVTAVQVMPSEAELLKNQTLKLTVDVFPDNATNQSVYFETSDPDVATVAGDGTITAVGGGECIITAISGDGGSTSTCRIKVTVPVSGITLTPEAATMHVNEEIQLSATLFPDDASDKEVNWTSSDAAVALVNSSGKVTAMGPGNAMITVKDRGGNFQAVCLITVPQHCSASGLITFEKWNDIRGTTIISLTSSPDYPENPSYSGTLATFTIPSNAGDNYGCRVSGYICAPATGYYRFWITSDGTGELWLSSNDSDVNKRKIAYNKTSTKPSQWNKSSTQRSYYIYLEEGNSYYVEALMKEGTGSDNLAVGWLKPGETGTVPSEIIPGSVLSPRNQEIPYFKTAKQSEGNHYPDRLDEIDFEVYPNPTSGVIHVTSSETIQENAILSIVSLTGQIISHKILDPGSRWQLDLVNYQTGCYHLRIRCQDKVVIRRILIAK